MAFVVADIAETRSVIAKARAAGKKIGLVPTMGALHEGHLSLIRASAAECEYTVVSVFVNPTQFGAGEDYERYPRDLESDARSAEAAGAGLVFAPAVGDIYPTGYATYVEVERLTDVLCGANRLGHFRGVTTVVTKLFNICKPDKAYFGQKDAQQAIIVKRMARDLDTDIEIRILPIVREPDGLAMSSRNIYLTRDQRRQATCLYRAVKKAEETYARGSRDANGIKKAMESVVSVEPDARVDYISVVDADELFPLDKVERPALVALAVFLGDTRLIDNTVLG